MVFLENCLKKKKREKSETAMFETLRNKINSPRESKKQDGVLFKVIDPVSR